MKPLRTSPSASAEFAEAVRWYELKRPGLGSEFFDAVAAAGDLIKTQPSVGASRGRARSWLIPRFPYRLVYRVREADIYIVAVAHSSRKPDYWKHRNR